MSLKLATDLINNAPKLNEKDSKEKLDVNHIFEEEFWKDCLASKEKNNLKNNSKEIVKNLKKMNSQIDVKERIKKEIIENISMEREKDKFQDKLKIMMSSKSTKKMNQNRESFSKLSCDKNGKETKIKSSVYDNLFPKTDIKTNNSLKSNSNKIKCASDSNNNSNFTVNTNLVRDKSKTMCKSLSMELLDNKKLKISQSLLNLINQDDKEQFSTKKRTFERTENLYQIRFKKNETLKKMKKQLDDCRIVYELEDCTFKPNINHDHFKREKSQNKNKNENNISFYERVNIWKKKKLEKSDNEKKQSKKREFAKCTFHPAVCQNVPVYNEKSSYDEGTIKYFERIHRARGEKLILKNQLNPNEGSEKKVYKMNFKGQNIEFKKDPFATFSPSKKSDDDIGSLKQSLRNQLNSINLNDFENYGEPEEKEFN